MIFGFIYKKLFGEKRLVEKRQMQAMDAVFRICNATADRWQRATAINEIAEWAEELAKHEMRKTLENLP